MRLWILLTGMALLGGCPQDTDEPPDPTDDTDTPDVTDTGEPDPTTNPTTNPTTEVDGIAITTCENPPVVDTEGDVCGIVAGDERVLLVGDVLLVDAVIEQGSVLVEDGQITCVGCDCDAAGATQVVCPDAVVSPGLINAHDHVGWMNGRPWVASEAGVNPDLRWEHRHDWRTGDRGDPEVRVSGGGASVNDKIVGEIRFLMSGATSIFGSGDLGGLLRDLDGGSNGSGLASPPADYETFPLGDGDGRLASSGCTAYSIRSPSFGTGSWAPHVAEGIDEEARNELRCLTGEGNGAEDLLQTYDAIIHGIPLQAPEAQTLVDRGVSVIWTPRSNVALYGETAPVTLIDTLGGSIGLGTDWLPTGSMNMFRELACAASLNETQYGGYFHDADLWRMATLGSASALAFDDEIGLIAPGYVADLTILANGDERHHSAVVHGSAERLALVLKGGEPLAGDPSLIQALSNDDCDALDACGVPKLVCLGDTGRRLADLPASVDDAIPCGIPDDEPTCQPARVLASDQVNGSTLYDGLGDLDDTDGDGISDIDDLCPEIFDPIRPVDDGLQPDSDLDGIGDVCDVCPLDADSVDCVPADPADLDGDGFVVWEDNCPEEANDQTDTDGDGKGDLCDPCPDAPNPGAEACETTIFALQDESDPTHPPSGTPVSVRCTITAAGPRLAWCQDALGGAYSGIAVFVGSTPSYPDGSPVAIGDDVEISAVYEEFFEVSELTDATFTFVAKGTLPAPVVIPAEELSNSGQDPERWEGVFVRVENVVVTNENPDAPNDFDEFEVTGGLRIDDFAADGSGVGGVIDNTFPVGTSFSSITGVHHHSFSNYKLLPRDANDLVP